MKNRLRENGKVIHFYETSKKLQLRAKVIQSNTKIYTVCATPLLPVADVHHKNP